MGVQLWIKGTAGIMRDDGGHHLVCVPVLILDAAFPDPDRRDSLDFLYRVVHRLLPPTGNPFISTDEISNGHILWRRDLTEVAHPLYRATLPRSQPCSSDGMLSFTETGEFCFTDM